MEVESIVFFVIASFMLISAGLVAFRPKPIESALWLIVNFFFTSALYVLIGADFAAIVQILVYAGAIVVLFTFVILLLNLDPEEIGTTASVPWTSLVMLLASVSAVLLCMHIATPKLLESMPALSDQSTYGTVEGFAREFLVKYVFGFEVAGVLLLLAVIGVGLLAYRKPAALPASEKEGKAV